MKDSNLSMSIDAQQLKAIFETAVDCLIIIDSKGAITKINPAGAHLFGYEPKELIGENVKLLMPSPHSEKHDEYIENYQHTGVAKIIGKDRDIIGKKKDGTLFPCSLSVNEFFMQSKKCFAGIIHDLTLRKKHEKKILELNQKLEEKIQVKSKNLSSVISKLIDSNKQLEKEIAERKKIEIALRNNELEMRSALQKERDLNDLKSRFVSMASHEFRTPLSTILSSTTLIENYIHNGKIDKTEKHFVRVKSSIQHLTEILDDFLSLTKLTEGQIPTSSEHFMLLEFSDEFIDSNQGLLKVGQTIEKQFPVKDYEVFLDKKLLTHILLNLFSNAIKYSDEGKKIGFQIEIIDNQIIVKVVDEGMGIPINDQKHLFSRFFRGTNVINIKGTGLGLNIVKEYLELMNGEISFDSKENIGTTFTIIIPL